MQKYFMAAILKFYSHISTFDVVYKHLLKRKLFGYYLKIFETFNNEILIFMRKQMLIYFFPKDNI